MKELFKDIDVGKRRFRISKFDALTGSYIMYTLLTQMLPMGLGKRIPGLENFAIESASMSKEKFMEIQRDCLRACSEVVPVEGQVTLMPLLMVDGRWGVAGVENDAPLILNLTVQVLVYNAKSFFEGDALEMFENTFSQLSSPNA